MAAQLSPLTSDHAVCFLSVAKISTKEVFHQKLISAVQVFCYDPEINTITVLEYKLDYEVVQYYSSSMVFPFFEKTPKTCTSRTSLCRHKNAIGQKDDNL